MAEPQHIKEILPSVMQSIVRQANRYREKHNLPTLQEEIRLKDEVSEKDTIFSVHSFADTLNTGVFGLKMKAKNKYSA